MTTQSTTKPDPLATFKADLKQRFQTGLDAPSLATKEVQRLLADLSKASDALDATSIDEVRATLKNIQDQEREKRGDELAVAICEAGASLGIMMRPATTPKRSRSHGSRPRYSPEQRQQLTQRLIAAIQASSSEGLSKSAIAQQLNLTPNQVKRILQWPEMKEQVVGIGAARHRRYALKTAAQSSKGDE